MKLFLFDLDGVLVYPDFSYFKVARREIVEFLKQFGISLSIESPFFKKVYDAIYAKFKDPKIAWEIYSEVSKRIEKYELEALSKAKLLIGFREILKELKSNGYMAGVFSQGARKYVVKALHILGCNDIIDVFVSRDDHIRPKPYPDGILKACATMGIESRECVFIGDTWLDVETALNAGAIPVIYRYDKDYKKIKAKYREGILVLEELTVENLVQLLRILSIEKILDEIQ